MGTSRRTKITPPGLILKSDKDRPPRPRPAAMPCATGRCRRVRRYAAG